MEIETRSVWQAYLSATTQLIERLDHELQQQSRLSLTDYEILSSLATANDRRLRMSELARQVLVSRSRLTYRVDRLAEVGYVIREECEDDRRGLWAILTESGFSALEQATGPHLADIERWFLTHMSEQELDVISVVMTRIDENLSGSRTGILR